MRTYENKDELKNEINKSFAKYISEFDIIPESLKDKRVEEVSGRTYPERIFFTRNKADVRRKRPCIFTGI